MPVGKKVAVPNEWRLGEKSISNTTSYKYLGEVVTNDNKNKKNIEAKENKIEITIRQINTTASSDIMRGVEARVLLILFEKCIIPSLTSNCESWTLSITDERQLDKIGIRALKRLFGLPTTTPGAAIAYSFGQLYITQEVDKKRFMFLHKVLSRENDHWTKQMMLHLQAENLGWAKNITEKLTQYGLETDWEVIRRHSKRQWKKISGDAVEKKEQEKDS